jgi:hypothetical protein
VKYDDLRLEDELDSIVLTLDYRPVGFWEIKRRWVKSDAYPDFIVSARKVEAAQRIARVSELPVVIVVGYNDRTVWFPLTEPSGFRLGGRTDRGDPRDVERMAVFSPVQLRGLEDNPFRLEVN